MTEKAKLCFNKFIKYGYNHLDFTEESIKSREVYILPELFKIQKKLPTELNGDLQIQILARDLSELAIALQGFAITNLRLAPSREMLVRNVNGKQASSLFPEPEKPRLYWDPGNPQVDLEISYLRSLCTGKRSDKNALKIYFGQHEVFLPQQTSDGLVESIIRYLEDYKLRRRKLRCEQRPIYRNMLFKMVDLNIAWYIQEGLLNNSALVPEQLLSLIAAIVLVAAGYLITPVDYEGQKRVKDYRPCLDKEHLSKTGERKKTSKARYYTYHEILNIQFSQIKKWSTMNLGSFHYCYR
jgi:hypothetical protein